MSVWKNVLKNFQMSEQYWGCSDILSEVNFSPAETLLRPLFLHSDMLQTAIHGPDAFQLVQGLSNFLFPFCVRFCNHGNVVFCVF